MGLLIEYRILTMKRDFDKLGDIKKLYANYCNETEM